ncbi:hypothetical protein [Rhodanobacter ginsengiterrae]|uniref:hypothetical protein n=1 Tax=Rhodanobacter ginsengiterrae TaxID=2008451 RepID=UPI003CF278BA
MSDVLTVVSRCFITAQMKQSTRLPAQMAVPPPIMAAAIRHVFAPSTGWRWRLRRRLC